MTAYDAMLTAMRSKIENNLFQAFALTCTTATAPSGGALTAEEMLASIRQARYASSSRRLYRVSISFLGLCAGDHDRAPVPSEQEPLEAHPQEAGQELRRRVPAEASHISHQRYDLRPSRLPVAAGSQEGGQPCATAIRLSEPHSAANLAVSSRSRSRSIQRSWSLQPRTTAAIAAVIASSAAPSVGSIVWTISQTARSTPTTSRRRGWSLPANGTRSGPGTTTRSTSARASRNMATRSDTRSARSRSGRSPRSESGRPPMPATRKVNHNRSISA